MELDDVIRHYGESVDLGPCLIGRVLNLTVLRGFAPLDALAVISAPDIFEQNANPNGTQRDLKEKHATEAFSYAMNALESPPESDARYFPELLLNVRDMNAVEIYSLDDPNELMTIDSFTDPSELAGLPAVGLRIPASQLQFPKSSVSPQISRVDGNHRLHRADEIVSQALGDQGSLPENFPTVAFACFVDLPREVEAKLFKDINHEQEGMETAHLTSIELRTTDPDVLRRDPKLRPLYLASKLADPGRAFDGMVFWGGNKKLLKAEGFMPPVNINSLRTTIHQQLRAAENTAVQFEDEPDTMLNLLDNFWKAVRKTFPEAWENKRDFILLQAVGMGGFAKFGGFLIDRAYQDGEVQVEDFENLLAPVAKKVPMKKSEWPGVAGAAGQELVARALIRAANPDEVLKEKVKNALQPKPTLSDALNNGAPQPDPSKGSD